MAEQHALATITWTPSQVETIKNTVAKGATNEELDLFLTVCGRLGLDPFVGQVHFMKRRSWNAEQHKYEERGVIQVGIDGHRTVAVRTSLYDGQDEPEFEGEGKLPDGTGFPLVCRVRVYRKDVSRPFVGVARWNEYRQTYKDNNNQVHVTQRWATAPYSQLAKCAEALALRKAFPQDLSGVYVNEEMDQADNPEPNGAIAVQAEVVEGGGESAPQPAGAAGAPEIDPGIQSAMGALGWPPGKCNAQWASWVADGKSLEDMYSELRAIQAGLVDEQGRDPETGRAPGEATANPPAANPPSAAPQGRSRRPRSSPGQPPAASQPPAEAGAPQATAPGAGAQQSLLGDEAPLPPEPPAPSQRRRAPF